MSAMQFDGSYGSLSVPVPDQQDFFMGEKGLGLMARYFQAFINAYGAEAYESVAWDEPKSDGGIIKYIFGHNPRERGEGTFRGSQAPALYVYRIGSKEVYDLTDDEHVMVSEVMALYVHPADNPEQLAIRYPYTAAVAKLVDLAIERRRDICFILPEDTDPRKAWRGTHVWRQCGFDRVALKEFRRSELEILDSESDGSWRYMALDMLLEVTERRVTGIDSPDKDVLLGVDYKVSENLTEGNVPVYPEYLRRIL